MGDYLLTNGNPATWTNQTSCLANQQQQLHFKVPFFSPAYSTASCVKMLGQNHFAKPNWHVLTFLHSIFLLMGPHTHTLSTCEAALTYRTQNVHNTNTRCFFCALSIIFEKKDGYGAKRLPSEKRSK